MQSDFWNAFWGTAGSVVHRMAASIEQDPWPVLAIAGLLILGLLLPAQQRRRRRRR